MPAERLLPDREAEDLIKLTREIARDELAPLASRYEEEERFPREQFRLLGRSGLLGLPYPAAGSPTRSTSRCSRRSRRPGCPWASGSRCT